MRSLLPLLFPALVLGCASTREADAPGGRAPQAAAAPAAKPKEERSGVLAPAEFGAIALWPEAYAGQWLVLEVVPHGTQVAQGDVLLRLDSRAIETEIQDAELEARSARVRHEALIDKQAIAEEGARAAAAQKRAALERARRALEGYEQHERTFEQRSDGIAARREGSWIEDQQDELAQLTAMYEADELTDQTEEIVLKRARRELDVTRLTTALSEDRRTYQDAYPRVLEGERRAEEVRVQAEALERLLREQEVERRERADALARSAAAFEKQDERVERLRRDLALFEIRAPRAGVALHGRLRDYRPGRTAQRIERGSQLAARTDVMLVADPARAALAIDLPEAELARVGAGARATVRPLARPAEAWTGTLALEAWPAPGGGDVPFEGTIELGSVPEGIRFGMHAKVELEPARVEG
jgi:multidrug resistance efflux pump